MTAVDATSHREGTLVLLAVVASCVIVGLVMAWGIDDARRDERQQLVAATEDPQLFDVSAGWFSEAGAIEELAAYYPSSLKVHAGDTVRFTNPTAEDPHTVTFGLAPDRSNQPVFATGVDLDVVNAPCVSSTPITASTVSCPGTIDAPAEPFADQPYFNTGIIPPGGGTFELQLSSKLSPGEYDFYCSIHPSQIGTLIVVPSEAPTQRPETVRAEARELVADDQTDLADLRARAARGDLDTDRSEVRAGAATDRASLNAFFPSQLHIRAGESVTWRNDGSVPHVVIFGGSLPPPVAAATPPTLPSGSVLPPGLFTTGPIGAHPYPRTSYEVTFHQPGTYRYICTFHPGMVGTVVVAADPPPATLADVSPA